MAIKSKRHGRVLVTLTAVVALMLQPMYGFVAAQVAHAVGVPGSVVINEFYAPETADWVELYNPTDSEVVVTGWVLRDSTKNTQKKVLDGAIPAKGFKVVDFSYLNDTTKDTIRLFDETDSTLIDSVSYGTGEVVSQPVAGQYVARKTDGGDTWELRASSSKNTTNVSTPTPGTPPTAPSLAITPATCANPVNTGLLTGDATDFRWEFPDNVRLQGELMPVGVEFNVVDALTAHGIAPTYGENQGQLIWHDRGGAKTDVFVQQVSFTLTDPTTLSCDTEKPTLKVNLNRTNFIENGGAARTAQNPELEAYDTNLNRIELSQNGIVTNTWTADAASRRANIRFLGEGSYTVRAYDDTGNASEDFNFAIDNTAPSNLAITLADGRNAQGALVSGTQTFRFTQTEPHPKSIYIEYMEKDANGTWRKKMGQEVLGQNSADLLVTTKNWLEGEHQVKVTTKDTAGNTASTVAKFLVDNTPPTVQVKDGFVGSLPAKVFSNVSFKLFDSQMVDRYELNGQVVNITDNKWGDANFQNIKAMLKEGSNTFVLYDIAGNTYEYPFIYDTTKPTVVLREDQAIKQSGSYFLTSKTVRVQPQDANRGTVFINGVEYPQYKGSGSFGINWIVANNPDQETFTVTTKDLAGNISEEYVILFDRTAPTISFKTGSGANDGTLGIGDWYRQVSFKLYDKNGNLKNVSLNGNTYNRGGMWNDLNWLNITKTHLNQGENMITVRDDEGNENTLLFNFDSIAPRASDMQQFYEQKQDGRVAVTLTFDEAVTGLGQGWYEVNGSNGKQFIKRYYSTKDYNVSFVDQAGNTGSYNFFVDMTPPTSTNNLADAVRGTVMVTQTVSDNVRAASGKLRIWKLDENGVQDSTKFFAIGDVDVDNDNMVRYTVDTQKNLYGNGMYIAKFTATDEVGNATVVERKFTVDNSIKVAINPINNSSLAPSITGQANWNLDGAQATSKPVHVEISSEGILVTTSTLETTTQSNGSWSVQAPALTNGKKYSVLAVVGTDAISGRGEANESVSINIQSAAQPGSGTQGGQNGRDNDGDGSNTNNTESTATISSTPSVPQIVAPQLSSNDATLATSPTPVLAAATPNTADGSRAAEVQGLSTTGKDENPEQKGEVKAAEDSKSSWSIVNILLAAVAVVMGLMALLGLLGKREDSENAMNGRRILAMVFGAVALGALFVLENFSGSMSVADIWTLGFAVIAVAQIAIITSLKRAHSA